jgi:hypothetical protein
LLKLRTRKEAGLRKGILNRKLAWSYYNDWLEGYHSEPYFYLKRRLEDRTLSASSGKKLPRMGPIDRVSPYLWSNKFLGFLFEDGDGVQSPKLRSK